MLLHAPGHKGLLDHLYKDWFCSGHRRSRGLHAHGEQDAAVRTMTGIDIPEAWHPVGGCGTDGACPVSHVLSARPALLRDGKGAGQFQRSDKAWDAVGSTAWVLCDHNVQGRAACAAPQ